MSSLAIALQELRKKLGQEKVITESDILKAYDHDETSDLHAMPDALIRAENRDDVSTILGICNNYKVPVIPRGAGSGVTGGAVPTEGGLVLSLEKMNRILEIDTANMTATVEPGVITGELQNAVSHEGLMYPPDPASLDMCSIGGNVAENAGGPRAVKYGTTRDYVIGLEFVLPDGTVMTTGGKYVKDATGYDMRGILLGSEGTLAVITKIILRLIPAPLHVMDLLIPFPTMEAAAEAVTKILQNRIVPATIEFMEKESLKLISNHLKGDIPHPDAGAHCIIQLDGSSEELIHSDLERLSEILHVNLDDVIAAENEQQRTRLWKHRKSMREAIVERSPVFFAEDSVVPRSAIPAFIKEIKSTLTKMSLHTVMFGHAGDGNVHIDVLKDELDYDEWQKLVPEIKKKIYSIVLKHKGTITGEHGIGYLRKKYLSMAISQEQIELQKNIKLVFDPHNILNPGKIFDR